MLNPKTGIFNGKLIHYSVGAVIKQDGKFLLIDRKKPPFGFAGLAGHVDEGETPEQALHREVREESGLIVVAYKLLYEEFIGWNYCSKGVTGHYWHLYECTVKGKQQENVKETKSIGHYTLQDLKSLTLEPVWEYWFKKLKII